MKKYVALALTLIFVLGLVGCGSTKYTCRAVSNEDTLSFEDSSLSEPFITNEERDELLDKAVKTYLNDLGNGSTSFTYEITETHLGVYAGKDTILCWVKIIYGEGFTSVMGFIIQ